MKIRIRPLTVVFLVILLLSNRDRGGFVPIAVLFLHEVGHLIAAPFCGVRVEEIELTLFGAEIRTQGNPPTLLQTLLLHAAGFLVNFLFAVIFWEKAPLFATCSLAIGLLNALPLPMLDGGHCLAALLSEICPMKADRIINVISAAFLVLLWLTAVFLLFFFGGNLSLLAFCFYLFFCLFLR